MHHFEKKNLFPRGALQKMFRGPQENGSLGTVAALNGPAQFLSVLLH